MKWIAIILGVLLTIAATYMVMTKGGALEMQQEHAVEAPKSEPAPAPAPATPPPPAAEQKK